MAGKTWIEVALNGPWGRQLQPGLPITVEDCVADGIAAAKAGAAIVHLHAYDPTTGRQNDDWQTYARIFEGIRREVDVILYPTIPLAGSGLSGGAASAQHRYAHVEQLAARGLIEWMVVDPGSVNFTRIDRSGTAMPGFVYLNPEADIVQGLAVAHRHALHPSYAIYEPGFTRTGAALARRISGLKAPIYRFMFSDSFGWGFPPRAYALEAHLALLGETDPGAAWMIAGLGVDVHALMPAAVALGGHVRVGLEDAPFGCGRPNKDLVEEAVRIVVQAGGEPATAAEVRASLGASG
jgi:3-keto-5-aminohexanoate cleavage enzyme